MTAAVFPSPFIPGFRLVDGTDLNNNLANQIVSSQTGITATASGTQATSIQITAEFTNVTTVATAADGVKLPLTKAGATYTIINNGAAALQVFGTSPDTINDVATATGVAQGAGTAVTYRCPVAGKWYSSANSYNAGTVTFTGLLAISTNGTVSAAGTNLTTATALTVNVNNLTTVGASTGVALPVGAVGQDFYVFNKGANNVKVYAAGGATIDGTAGATGVTLGSTAGTNSCIFFCVAAATYVSAKLGAVSS